MKLRYLRSEYIIFSIDKVNLYRMGGGSVMFLLYVMTVKDFMTSDKIEVTEKH